MEEVLQQERIQSEPETKTSETKTAPAVQKQKNSKGVILSRVAVYAVLVLYSLWILVPFLIIIVTSFTTNAEYGSAESYIWFPKNPSFEGYKKLFTDDPFMYNGVPSLLRGFFNTMWITLIPLISGLIQSLLVAYVYSRYNFPCKNFLFIVTVSLMFIPLGAFGFVGYMFYRNIGWTEGGAAVLPMIVPGLFAGAGTVFFLRPYVEGINKEIIEAAEIDGMGFWRVFVSIIIPLSKPALVAQFIFGFVGGYNNYSGALLYLNDNDELWTLQLSLQQLIAYLSTSEEGDYNFQCATALMSMLPLVALYIGCQKFFIEGISFGGGKE